MTQHQKLKRNISIVTKYTTLPLLIFASTPVLAYLAGGGLWYWLTVIVLLVCIVLDPIVGDDPVNAPAEMEAKLEASNFYRFMLWLYIPVQFLMTLFCYSLISNTPLEVFTSIGVAYQPLGLLEIIGLTLSLVLVTGFGATPGHELCHHGNQFDRFMGQALLTPISMADFYVYHNFHHHLTVATPEDHATAPYGENFWRFALRSTINKSICAWQVEAKRLARKGSSWLNLDNKMIKITLAQVAWFALLAYLFGWISIPLFIMQYIFPRMLLATADFAEHYGLMRKQLADGSYEKIRPEHAWDDSMIISSFFMCQIDRHSDHHTNVGRPYQVLRVMENAPRLPYGYLNILFVTMVPSAWRKLMHPIIEEFYDNADIIPYALPDTLPERFRDRAVIADIK
jgi:alkane 1-monooxygenase